MVSNIGVILETRIGLKTIERKKITARGIKPIGLVQWNFKAYYLYGAVAPQTGENFWLEFSHLDGQCFQIFLHNLAAEYPEHLNVVQLDNGKFHHSSQLKIADNILLVFQPPYSPDLNPIERIWQYIKQELSWGLYDNLDEIKEKVRSFLEEFSTETIASIAGWDYIRSALATLCMILEKWYKYRTNPEIAALLIKKLSSMGFNFNLLRADSLYGESSTKGISVLDELKKNYIVAIR